MVGRRFLMLAVSAMALSACTTYRLDRADQLYLGQSYLPLPKDFGNLDVSPNAQARVACDAPPAIERSIDLRQSVLQPLPGMTLHVAETTYRRDAAEALPVMADWRWRLPPAASCAAAGFDRRDLLVMRHLLTGGRQNEPTPDVSYFADAMKAAACASGRCSPQDVRAGLLDPFVRNLKIDYRRAQQRNDTPLEPQVPSDVKAPQKASDTLANWFRSEVVAPQTADFFDLAKGGRDAISTICGGLYGPRSVSAPGSETGLKAQINAANGEVLKAAGGDNATWNTYRDALKAAPITGDPPSGVNGLSVGACNFSYKSLLLDQGAEKDNLVLLTSGDTLLLFRPLAHNSLLDTSRREVCAGTPPCKEADRLSQGFLDFDVTFAVTVSGREGGASVTPDMSLKDFEDRFGAGRRIVSVTRSARWVPTRLAVVETSLNAEKPKTLEEKDWRRKDALRITLVPDGSESGVSAGGITAREAMKSQILLAPGDEITFGAPSR